MNGIMQFTPHSHPVFYTQAMRCWSTFIRSETRTFVQSVTEQVAFENSPTVEKGSESRLAKTEVVKDQSSEAPLNFTCWLFRCRSPRAGNEMSQRIARSTGHGFGCGSLF